VAGLKARWRATRPRFFGHLLFLFVRTLCSTLRVKEEGYHKSASHPARIYCGWHGKSVLFANYFRNQGIWVLISHSNDGEMQSRLFGKLGYRIIRGSTGRGGARALIESIKALRDGGSMAMTPDGPRGPSGVVQGGIMAMAQKSGAALVPVGLSARPRWLAPSWDRYMVPCPFGRGLMLFGDPILVPAKASETEVEAIRLQLEQAIQQLEEEADRRMGYGAPSVAP
jgi:lysophospholipid acyltransferase (LPLAT)-like uncharacterized protein